MKKSFALALMTYRELIRSKALYLSAFFAALLICTTTLFGSATVGDQIKIIKDLGLLSISLCTIGYTVIAGSSLLAQELSKKTIYTILSKSVKRSEFIIGKFLGMLLTVATMLCMMGGGLTVYVALFEGQLDPLLILGVLSIGFELCIICAATLFFSAVAVTPVLVGLCSFSLYLAGRSTHYILLSLDQHLQGERTLIRTILEGLYWTIPHLNDLSIAQSVVYGIAPSSAFWLWSILYTLGYSGALLVLALMAFSSKEFK
jgi:ABC-type transport system involved in multi-copper enzyme maturation permease subunit